MANNNKVEDNKVEDKKKHLFQFGGEVISCLLTLNTIGILILLGWGSFFKEPGSIDGMITAAITSASLTGGSYLMGGLSKAIDMYKEIKK